MSSTKKVTCNDLVEEGYIKYAGPSWCCCECVNNGISGRTCKKIIKVPGQDYICHVCCSVWMELDPKGYFESYQEQLNA